MPTRTFALLFALAACGDDGLRLAEPLEVLTFNAGLAPGNVAAYDERAPLVVADLRADTADVLCVQELWVDDDYEALIEGGAFVHAQRHPAELELGIACVPGELDPLAECAAAMCPGLTGIPLGECASAQCGDELFSLTSSCQTCAITVASGDEAAGPAEVRAGCEGVEGSRYIYGGTYDTALLSRYPATVSESLVLDSSLVRASVEYAQLATPGGGVHVFCTHFASSIGGDEAYEGAFGTWRGEQERQVEQLIAWIDERVGPDDHVIVTGDLNTGPAVPGTAIEAEWVTSYDRLVGATQLTNAYAASADVACTSCPDNSFHDPGSRAKLIDHVLHSESLRLSSAQRTHLNLHDLGEDLGESHLSDHYGLRVVLAP